MQSAAIPYYNDRPKEEGIAMAFPASLSSGRLLGNGRAGSALTACDSLAQTYRIATQFECGRAGEIHSRVLGAARWRLIMLTNAVEASPADVKSLTRAFFVRDIAELAAWTWSIRRYPHVNASGDGVAYTGRQLIVNSLNVGAVRARYVPNYFARDGVGMYTDMLLDTIAFLDDGSREVGNTVVLGSLAMYHPLNVSGEYRYPERAFSVSISNVAKAASDAKESLESTIYQSMKRLQYRHPGDGALRAEQLWFLATYEFRSPDPIVPQILELLSRDEMPTLAYFPETVSPYIERFRNGIDSASSVIKLGANLSIGEIEYTGSSITLAVDRNGTTQKVSMPTFEAGGGGDCFYYAVLAALKEVKGDVISKPSVEEMMAFRRGVFEHFAQNYLRYVYLSTLASPFDAKSQYDISSWDHESILNFCLSVRTMGLWAADAAASVAAEALNVEIVVITNPSAYQTSIAKIQAVRYTPTNVTNTIFILGLGTAHFQLIERSNLAALLSRV